MRQRRRCLVDFCRLFQRVARLFSRNFCASGIASKALRDSQEDLSNGLVDTQKQSGIEPVGLAATEWPQRNSVQVSIELF